MIQLENIVLQITSYCDYKTFFSKEIGSDSWQWNLNTEQYFGRLEFKHFVLM